MIASTFACEQNNCNNISPPFCFLDKYTKKSVGNYINLQHMFMISFFLFCFYFQFVVLFELNKLASLAIILLRVTKPCNNNKK